MIRDPKPKRGRPTLPDDERQSAVVNIRTTHAKKGRWKKAATRYQRENRLEKFKLKDFMETAAEKLSDELGVPRYDQ